MFISNSKYRRLNLFGQHLVIAANPNPPMFYGTYDTVTGAFKASHGVDVSFLEMLSHYFNCTYTIADQKGEWGLEALGDGPYRGLLGAVISGNATFGLGAVSIRLGYGREALIEFTTPNIETRITFLTLEAPRVFLTNVLLRPLSPTCWFLVLSLLLVLLLLGRLLTRLTRSSIDLDWLALGSLLLKAPTLKVLPRCLPYTSQYYLQLSWITGFLLLTVYSSVIIAFVSQSFKFGNIDHLRQFNARVREGKMTPILVRSSTFIEDFKEYRNISKTFALLLDTMEEVATYREGFSKMTREKLANPGKSYALIGQHMVMSKWTEHLGAKYFHLRPTAEAAIFTDRYGLVFKAASNLTAHFDRFIRITTETGFFAYWARKKYKWTSSRTEIRTQLNQAMTEGDLEELAYDVEDSMYSFDILQLQHLDEHFYLLFIGTSIGSLTLACEIYLKLTRKPAQGRQRKAR